MERAKQSLPALLTTVDVSELLAKPRGWVYDAVEAGVLPAIKVGRHLRFDPDEIGVWLEERRVGR